MGGGARPAPVTFAESSGPPFEVASSRPFEQGQGPAGLGLHMDHAQLRAVGLPLKGYLSSANGIKALLISGPHWTETGRFEITATLPAGGTPARVSEMPQALLAVRFQVKLHKDMLQFTRDVERFSGRQIVDMRGLTGSSAMPVSRWV